MTKGQKLRSRADMRREMESQEKEGKAEDTSWEDHFSFGLWTIPEFS